MHCNVTTCDAMQINYQTTLCNGFPHSPNKHSGCKHAKKNNILLTNKRKFMTMTNIITLKFKFGNFFFGKIKQAKAQKLVPFSTSSAL